MPRTLFFLVVAVFALSVAVVAGETGTRAIASWSDVTTAEGWRGRRYMDGSRIFAEEFDSNADGRIDVWRFYRRGMLSTEERDLLGAGKVTYQSRWDAPNGRLISVFRDTGGRGVNDLEIEAQSTRTWEIREDRNHDGVTDRVLFVNGPPDLFELLGLNPATERDLVTAIPTEFWHEMWLDDGFTCTITEYRRYSRGILTHVGVWRNNRIAWERCPPDYVSPPPPLPEVASTEAPVPAPQPDVGHTEPSGVYTDGGASDPYGQQPPYIGTEYVEPRIPSVSDRTRYEALPPGESSARSVPARMRMPGVRNR